MANTTVRVAIVMGVVVLLLGIVLTDRGQNFLLDRLEDVGGLLYRVDAAAVAHADMEPKRR